MAYPTKESNDREGGSPNKQESERVGEYVEETKNHDEPNNSDSYVDRKHPHQDADDRKTGDHPHKHLARQSGSDVMDKDDDGDDY